MSKVHETTTSIIGWCSFDSWRSISMHLAAKSRYWSKGLHDNWNLGMWFDARIAEQSGHEDVLRLALTWATCRTNWKTGPGAYIDELLSCGPKNYAYKVKMPGKRKRVTVVKVRGFRLDSTVQKILNFYSMKRILFAFVKNNCKSDFNVVTHRIEPTGTREIVTTTCCKKCCIRQTCY